MRALAVVAVLLPCMAQSPAPYFTRESVLPAGGSHAEPLRAGMLVSLYGRHLSSPEGCGTHVAMPLPRPYPTVLCGVSVTVAGKPAGLLAVLDSQINLEVPQGVPTSGLHAIQVIIGNTRGTPVDVEFGSLASRLSLVEPAIAGMPVWLRIDRGHPRGIYYPYSADPWDFGGAVLEVKRDGGVLAPYAPAAPSFGGVRMGLLNGSSAPEGSPRSRLPLHLAVPITTAGHYQVRYLGHEEQPGPSGIVTVETDRSEWFAFDVQPPDAAKQEAWLLQWKARLANATAGELAGDLLPSALALPREWMIPLLLDLTHWSDRVSSRTSPSIEHGEQMVQLIAAQCLRAFPPTRVREIAVDYAHRSGPTTAMARLVDDAGIRTGLASAEGWAQEGALVAINSRQTRAFDGAVLDAADRILRIGDRHAVAALTVLLGTIHGDASRALLWRIAGARTDVSEQALICLAWLADPRDLDRLGELLLIGDPADPYGYRKAALPYQLEKHYGERSYPYLRRAMRESPQLWVRKEAALPLARKGDTAAFAALLDVIAKQPSAEREILRFLRDHYPALKTDAAALAFLRERAGR